MSARGRNLGFSLIEILVVISIIAIVTSIAVLSLGLLGDDRALQTEARRMVALLELAEDEATMQGRDFGMEFMTSAYRFVEYDVFLDSWGDVIGDDTLRMRELPEDLELELLIEDKRVTLQTEPAAFTDPDDEDNAPTLLQNYAPHLFIFSSGDTAPFELRIRSLNDDRIVILRRDELGVFETLTEED